MGVRRGHEGGVHMTELVPLYKETPESLLTFLLPCEDAVKGQPSTSQEVSLYQELTITRP